MATKAQLQAEIDRLACELMRFNGVDIDEIEALRERVERAEADVERYRQVVHHQNRAAFHSGEAMRHLLDLGKLVR